MKKNDKIFIIIFIGIVSFSLLYLFQASYAKYRRQVNGNVQARIASWNIKVNTESIINKTELTNNIVPVIDTNQYVKENVIAPGTGGYFDITINATNVDVDFTFEIETNVDDTTPLADLVFTKYTLNGTQYNYSTPGKITGNIAKNTANTSLRIYFKWNDDATNTMDNADDTAYATDETHENTEIAVSIKFTQRNTA